MHEQSDEHNIEFENITVMEEDGLAVIMNLDNNKAHGADNISLYLITSNMFTIK